MEVSEATGQNVQKSSSSTSESLNEMSFEKLAHGSLESKLQLHKSSEQSLEQSSNASKFQSLDVAKSHQTTESVSTNVTVVTTEETKVVNGDTNETVTVSTTVTVVKGENGAEKSDQSDETEEIIEVIEVTDDESGEDEVVETITTTTTTKTVSTEGAPAAIVAEPVVLAEPEAPIVTKVETIESEKPKEEPKPAVAKPAEEEESASEEEEDEEEVQKEVLETKTVEQVRKQESVASETAAESQQAEVVDSLAQLKITEQPTATVTATESSDMQARRASVAEGVQRPIQQAVSIPQTAPVQQTAPIQQTALIEQTLPVTQAPHVQPTPVQPTAYAQPAPVQPTAYAQPAPVQPTAYAQPAPVAYAQPTQPASHQIPQENIRHQLQEIVSDIDRAVEEHKLFSQASPQSVQSTVSSQNTSTEIFKKTTSSGILQQPNYYYQEDNATTTTSSSKPIDLQKIFTPATDADVILPNKNRKLYASSAFFTPGLHPTVEDQVELARRISSSLSDSNNKQSKGQTMYVNRKKRSVKWVHEGEGENENVNLNGFGSSGQFTEENSYSTQRYESKIPLKLVMDPRGVVQDVQSQGITYDHSSGMLSPDKCAELVSALHTDAPKGKGAELFAKRRKRSEKWIVDETTRSANNPALTSYSAGPTQIFDTNQFNQSSYQSVDNQANYQQSNYQQANYNQAPWETQRKEELYRDNVYSSSPSGFKPQYQPPAPTTLPAQPYTLPKQSAPVYKKTPNSLRDLAYKPSIPQGWNAPPPQLPNVLSNQNDIKLDTDELATDLISVIKEFEETTAKIASAHQSRDSRTKSDDISSRTEEKGPIDYFNRTKEALRHVAQFDYDVNNNEQNTLDGMVNESDATDSDEDYVKIPVQQLITTFEKQMRSIIKQKINENIQIKMDGTANNKKISAMYINKDQHFNGKKIESIPNEPLDRPKAEHAQLHEEKYSRTESQVSHSIDEQWSTTGSTTINQNHDATNEYATSESTTNRFNSIETPLDDHLDGAMFTPPEIPLSGYTPPQTDAYLPASKSSSFYPHHYENTYVPPPTDLYTPSGPSAAPSLKRIDPSQVYGDQFPVQNFTPKPFTPSPIAQEKLAVFEQSRQLAHPVIRRPLTAPNQRVSNVSPAPFGGQHHFDSHQSAPWSAPQSNRMSGSFGSSPPNYNSTPNSLPISAQPSPRMYDSSHHQDNYNRAARGWGQSKDFYQPISFNKPQPVELPYTDF